MPELLCIMLASLSFVGLALAFLITATLGFTRWRKSSAWWMMPALICLVFLLSAWLSPPLGRLIADRQFERHSSDYLQVVEEVQSGSIPCPAECGIRLTPIDVKRLPPRIRAVVAARCNSGAAVVGFLLDTDAPLVHEGYVYRGYDESQNCITEDMKPEKRWPYVRKITGNWYRFSDQPGL